MRHLLVLVTHSEEGAMELVVNGDRVWLRVFSYGDRVVIPVTRADLQAILDAYPDGAE